MYVILQPFQKTKIVYFKEKLLGKQLRKTECTFEDLHEKIKLRTFQAFEAP